MTGFGGENLSERDISLTFAKGLTVLKVFDSERNHLTLPQIAKETGLDRAIVRRLVLTLVHLGYVQQQDRVFSLTPRILVLAGGFLQARRFGRTIEPLLRSFSGQISESISMAMIDGHDAVYVAHAGVDTRSVSIGFTVGSRAPLLQTAIGRALVAVAPPEVAAQMIAHASLRRFTDLSMLDRGEIALAIAETKARGYAHVDGEFEAGVAAVAVPVRSEAGEVASLGISCNRELLRDEAHLRQCVDALRECGKVVASLL